MEEEEEDMKRKKNFFALNHIIIMSFVYIYLSCLISNQLKSESNWYFILFYLLSLLIVSY